MLRLLRHLAPYRWQIAGVCLLVVLQNLAELLLPTLMADIVDRGVFRMDTPLILRTGAMMLAVTAVGAACSIGVSLLAALVSTGFGRRLRSMVFAREESFSLDEFDRLGTATLIIRCTNDITQVQQVVFMVLRMALGAPVMLVGGIVMALAEDAALSWLIVVVTPLLGAAVWAIAARGMPLFRAVQARLDRLNLVLREQLTGIRVIRAFNRVGWELERFDQANRDLTQVSISVNQLLAAMMPVVMLLMNVTAVAVVWFGGLRIDQGQMQVGSLMAFIQYVMLIMFSLVMLSMLFVMVPRAAVSAGRINEVLETEPEIVDPLLPREPVRAEGGVEYRGVTFSYHGAEHPALQDISFTARAGEFTAIIGSTGSGKSTLVNLLLRFYDVDRGAILVDGVDVREMSQASLRSRIGYVPQQAVLFSGTIADNIRYGKEDATEEEIRHAAAIAQAADFIEAMPQGYQSVVAQGGTNLSGGQRQRLAIARALVRRPQIYVFDDSFSALDFQTDARLRQALRRETRDATVFLVAQRVGSVMDADRIIVLEEGRIAAMGTHRELMECCQVYREIACSQLAEEALA
ncbi:MAG: ABC transporter ATP-binding protein [Syntrophomonadaceae bacterium]|nr:ABC transporter ATP-binding protein/permease [Syntrophomonadaceae bacterium]MDH7497065.1 ABC transporter ATP-binding protein [Syntrophomonadaceae bacterium]